MTRKADESRKDLKGVEDARTKARRKVALIYPNELKGNVICHLDRNSLNSDLRNLAIMSRSDHMRLHTFLRKYKIPKGRASKKFALKIKSKEWIDMIYPIKKKSCVMYGFNVPCKFVVTKLQR